MKLFNKKQPNNSSNEPSKYSVSLVYQNQKSIMLRTLILNAKDEANAFLKTIEYFKEETDGYGLVLKGITRIV